MAPHTSYIIGGVVGAIGVLGLVAGIIVCIVLLRRRLGLGRRRSYAVAESIAMQNESEFGNIDHQRRGPSAAGLGAGPDGRRAAELRDNYADRDAIDYRGLRNGGYHDLDGGVRPASPTAERVEGVTIENRIRPRRNLPRGRVVVHNGEQDVCLDFSGVQRVPQAGPPPLTEEEKQRIEDERNRIASPDFYGTAEYEHRRASNTNTPNVLLSSSLLQELQRQYCASGNTSVRAFNAYASEGSVGSMSFRPGSPAGSVRRARRGQRSPTPNGGAGGLGRLRRRHGSQPCDDARPGAHAATSSTGPRNRHDDLESTSDDFDDTSLHDASFNAKREQLREFILRQQQQLNSPTQAQQHLGSSPLQLSPTLGAGLGSGFDQMSLRGTSPVFPDRNAASGMPTVSGGGGRATAGSTLSVTERSIGHSYLSAPPPREAATGAGLPPLGASFQSYTSHPSTAGNSPVVELVGAPVHPGQWSTSGGRPPNPVLSADAALAINAPLPLSPQAGGKRSTEGSDGTETNARGHHRSTHTSSSSPAHPTQRSSGLRSPFATPDNDPVTASDSPNSGDAGTHHSAAVTPLQRAAAHEGAELRPRHTSL